MNRAKEGDGPDTIRITTASALRQLRFVLWFVFIMVLVTLAVLVLVVGESPTIEDALVVGVACAVFWMFLFAVYGLAWLDAGSRAYVLTSTELQLWDRDTLRASLLLSSIATCFVDSGAVVLNLGDGSVRRLKYLGEDAAKLCGHLRKAGIPDLPRKRNASLLELLWVLFWLAAAAIATGVLSRSRVDAEHSFVGVVVFMSEFFEILAVTTALALRPPSWLVKRR